MLPFSSPGVAAEPQPLAAPQPKAGGDVPGALVIVGGGLMPDTIRDRFLELAGGAKAKLVVIPTASEVADRTKIYKSYAYWRTQGIASVALLHTLEKDKANDPLFIKPLTEATAVWLGGGDQTRLCRAYRGTAVEKELRRLLARGGVIGGTSAGASAMSEVMITGGNPTARVGIGLGLLPDVVIDQHFQNRQRLNRLLGVLSKYPHCLGLGIDEQTAVVVQGRTMTVLGNANVRLCLPPREKEPATVKVLKPGQVEDLCTAVTRIKPAGETVADPLVQRLPTTP
jgi:cyanophycinase